MNNIVHFEKLFVYAEEYNLYSDINFRDGVNIIYGKNTSGKSTVYQSLLYTLGVNEYNDSLSDILKLTPFFRLDCKYSTRESNIKICFIRHGGTLAIKNGDNPIRKFIGINSNTSNEHIRLKEYISSILGFSLKLEQNGNIKSAPLEALLLPYYISQTLGWVYLRKSFSNLDFYKNFKEDYLDYYTGITNTVDREEKTKLERKKRELNLNLEFYKNIIDNRPEIVVSKLEDEENEKYSIAYIEGFKELNNDIAILEKEYTLKCNELSYVTKRIGILRTIKNNLNNQRPEVDQCPTCDRALNSSVSDWYKYLQDKNDTEKEMQNYKKKSEKLKSELNSLMKKLKSSKEQNSEKYNILMSKYSKKQSYKSWLENKTNLLLDEKCKKEIAELSIQLDDVEQKLSKFKSNQEILAERSTKNAAFSSIFSSYLKELGVNIFSDKRFLNLYDISAFPTQGVELHKTVLAYHFAFNRLIKETHGIHRIPFMLDAVFREDIETENKELILKFISKYYPNDTQIIISIAESTKDNQIVSKYNDYYFNRNANLISIGRSITERSFLQSYNNDMDNYIEETIDLLYVD